MNISPFSRMSDYWHRICCYCEKHPQIVAAVSYVSWIDASKQLPPMFKDVIVWGQRYNENSELGTKDVWKARRWTGHNQCEDFGARAYWEWLGNGDWPIKNVTFWMPLPEGSLKY
jgi:hypothetical protein